MNSYGNYYTCQAQGFFISFVVGSYCYNVCLAIFYVLAVKYSKTENWLKKKIEPWMHIISVSYSLTISITMLPFGFNAYANRYRWCFPNEENEFAKIIMFRFSEVIIWLISILMIVMYRAVKEQQKIVESYSSGNTMRNRTSQSRKVARQCFAFSASFYIAYVPVMIESHLNLDEPLYPLTLVLHLCVPLQGFLNAVVYFLPRIVVHLTNFKNKVSTQAVSE